MITGVVDGGGVASWPDSSTSNAPAGQVTSVARPTFVRNWRNSRSGVQFDGVNDFMTAALAISQPASWVLVGKSNATNGTKQFYIDGNGNLTRQIIYDSPGTPDVWAMFAGTDVFSVTAVDTTQPFIIQALFNGAASKLWLNGTQIAAGNAGSETIPSLTIGAKFGGAIDWASVTLAQIIVYSRALSSGERVSLDHTLSTYYGIPVSD